MNNIPAINPLQAAPRCGARTKRGGNPCRAPAMANGRCRLHGGKSTGAPTGNKNAWRHGKRSGAAIAERAAFRALLREMQAALGSSSRSE